MPDMNMFTPASAIVDTLNRIEGTRARKVSYRYWQVENLITQASAMIDRCVDLKNILDDLWALYAEQRLQRLTDERASAVSEIEKSAGVDERLFSDAVAQLSELQNLRPEQIVPNFPDRCRVGMRDALASAAGAAQQITLPDDGQTKNKTATTWSGYVSLGQITAATIEYGLREKALARLIAYENLVSGARQSTRQGANEVRQLRQQLISSGPLDYELRIRKFVDNLIAPFLVDITERCEAATIGLQNIFGYIPEPLPPKDIDMVEAYSGWIRQQMSFLAKFGHFDQGYVTTISLSRLPSKPTFKEGVATSFRVPSSQFSSHSFCRLRGISVFVETHAKSEAVFRATVSLPRVGVYISDLNEELPAVDQSEIPACVLGRATSRSALRTPEVGGTVSMINASPRSHDGADAVGAEWSLLLEQVSGTPMEITDVAIELSLVGVPITPN